jgi:hypothetical protein
MIQGKEGENRLVLFYFVLNIKGKKIDSSLLQSSVNTQRQRNALSGYQWTVLNLIPPSTDGNVPKSNLYFKINCPNAIP